MVVRSALLVESFAIVVLLYGGFTVMSPDLSSYPLYLHAGFYLGVLGLVYGVVGSIVVNARRDEA